MLFFIGRARVLDVFDLFGQLATMSEIIMSISNIAKVFPNGKELLKGISLSFFKGAKIGVVGVNGSGKTSLLRIIAGEDREFQGELFVEPKAKVGYLPQEPKLDTNLDVRGNVELGLKESRELLNTYNTLSMKLCEPMEDDEMQRTMDAMSRAHNPYGDGRASQRIADYLAGN